MRMQASEKISMGLKLVVAGWERRIDTTLDVDDVICGGRVDLGECEMDSLCKIHDVRSY